MKPIEIYALIIIVLAMISFALIIIESTMEMEKIRKSLGGNKDDKNS